MREGLLVLDWNLCVHSANQSFYEQFKVTPEETEGRMVYELGNGQWNIPELREALEKILPEKSSFDDYEVEHEFEEIRPPITPGYREEALEVGFEPDLLGAEGGEFVSGVQTP